MDIENYLLSEGVPSEYILLKEESLPPSILERLDCLKTYLKDTLSCKVIIITGKDSPIKEKLTVCILKYFIANNKTISYITDTEKPKSLAYVNAFVNITSQTIKIKSVIFKAIKERLFVILFAPTIKSLETTYGSDFADYLSHCSVAINADTERQEVFEIT